MIAFTITEQKYISLIIDGKSYHINPDFPFYQEIVSNLQLYLEHFQSQQSDSPNFQNTIKANLIDIIEIWTLKKEFLSVENQTDSA
jgi:hypothetical protein